MEKHKGCIIMDASSENLDLCAKRIREGKLVAFPTETVYGLGANALDGDAVLSIYEAKKRPKTDPLIVHVTSLLEMEPLVCMTDKQRVIVSHLADKFWPGPLTMILKASEIIPPEITANTGFVGIRIPNHKTAIEFIKASGVPIAAPSANLFNHVSPTSATHVYEDFKDIDLAVIDDGHSTLGIESTVVKVEDDKISFLRLGSLPKKEIDDFIQTIPELKDLTTEYMPKRKEEKENCEAPGQFIKHYSPYVKTYILSQKHDAETIDNNQLSKSVIIDFNDSHKQLDDKILKRLSLSNNGNLKEAMYRLYYTLRVAENIEGADFILIANLSEFDFDVHNDDYKYFDAVHDKIFRAASGEYRKLIIN